MIDSVGRYAIVISFGVVLIYLPVRFVPLLVRPSEIGGLQIAGVLIGITGVALALWCASTFAVVGHGTPAPFAAPRRLVTRGPYKLLRNPMYVGVGGLFVGTALFYRSSVFLVYSVLFFLASHLFVVLYEEPSLRRHFGGDYSDYCRRVGRWRPRL